MTEARRARSPRAAGAAPLALAAAGAGLGRILAAPAWRYEQGFMALAAFRAGRALSDGALASRALDWAGAVVAPDGTIAGYREAEYNLDQVNPGKLLFHCLAAAPGEARWRAALDALRGQLERQPREPGGGYWHKLIYPDQVWLDGLYMAEPFAARYAAEFGRPGDFPGIVRQFALAEAALRDPATGLLKHGWDASRRQAWCDPATGASPCFWGRAMGWYAMALVDVLDCLPPGGKEAATLSAILERLVAAVIDARDPGTGLWWQLLDRPSLAGNYLESSASAMFAYALLKAARKGYTGAEGPAGRLAEAAARAGLEAWDSLVSAKLGEGPGGAPVLRDCCLVAGLGGEPYRDGSPAYYLGEPRVSDDSKGVAALVLAGLEAAALRGELPATALEETERVRPAGGAR